MITSGPASALPDLSLSKVVSAGDMPGPGDTIIWTLDYANLGDATANNTLLSEIVPMFTTFNDGDSTGGWSCFDGSGAGTSCLFPLGSLPPGSGANIDFAVTVVAGYTGSPIVNTASISSDGTDGDPTNNTVTSVVNPDPTTVPEPTSAALFLVGLAGIGGLAGLRRLERP
jgi:uncharacterized repeat protein (TIGR01451 family)